MSKKESTKHTIVVALLLCIVCSVIVSAAAVLLKPVQSSNRLVDRNKNILMAAGLYQEGVHKKADIARMFAEFSPRFVDLDNGVLLTDEQAASLGLDAATYDQRAAAKDPKLSDALDNTTDIASISRRVKYALVYLLVKDGAVDRLVLPIQGYGLWGTLYGFMAVKGDGKTVIGLGFYDHKETPGLGGEVDNPKWKQLWVGKQLFDVQGVPSIELVKGVVDHGDPASTSKVDALSGATLTSKGVQNLIRFWTGEHGFGPFLRKLGTGEL